MQNADAKRRAQFVEPCRIDAELRQDAREEVRDLLALALEEEQLHARQQMRLQRHAPSEIRNGMAEMRAERTAPDGLAQPGPGRSRCVRCGVEGPGLQPAQVPCLALRLEVRPGRAALRIDPQRTMPA
jgi:hypothetical protein